METGAPIILLDTAATVTVPLAHSSASSTPTLPPSLSSPSSSSKHPLTTRRARKQLLHRLSKQPVATAYSWQAMAGFPQGGPTTEEGWARVLPAVPALPLEDAKSMQGQAAAAAKCTSDISPAAPPSPPLPPPLSPTSPPMQR